MPASACRCSGRVRPVVLGWLAGLAAILAVAAAFTWQLWRPAPGQSFAGPPPAPTVIEKSLAERLSDDVATLSTEFGERTLRRYDALTASADWIAERLAEQGLVVRRQQLEVSGKIVTNVEASLLGTRWPDELIVIGAHYDTAPGTPGANGNGSGVAATLALAQALGGQAHPRSLVFVFFPCAARPYLQTERMGSLAWARATKVAGRTVVAMLSLDSLGYFSDEPSSQHFPGEIAAFFPKVGNFVAVVGDFSSMALVHRVAGLFREVATVPSQLGFGPQDWDGIGWSDHWSFWQCGWPAVVISDTGPYRDPSNDRWNDTAGRLDYETMARIVVALESVVTRLAGDA